MPGVGCVACQTASTLCWDELIAVAHDHFVCASAPTIVCNQTSNQLNQAPTNNYTVSGAFFAGGNYLAVRYDM